MRIVRISSISGMQPGFDLHYHNNQLHDLPYAGALESLRTAGFLTSSSWSSEMNLLGNDAYDCVSDSLLLQNHWAKEHGISLSTDTAKNRFAILVAQLQTLKPEIVLIYAGSFWQLLPPYRAALRHAVPSIQHLIGLWGDMPPPAWDYSDFKDLSLVFGIDSTFIRIFQEQGMTSVLVPNCFDPVLAPSPTVSEKPFPFIFAGSSGYGFDDHRQRFHHLHALLQYSSLQIWCNEELPLREPLGKKILKECLCRLPPTIGKGLLPSSLHARYDNLISRFHHRYEKKFLGKWHWYEDELPLAQQFPHRCAPPLFGRAYYELLSKSKIVYNSHQDDPRYGGNIRMFEATGLGACLLTDRAKLSSPFFDVDSEIVGYDSIEECLEKVRYLLAHEEIAKAIAARGQKRTLTEHTVRNRCFTMHTAIHNHLK